MPSKYDNYHLDYLETINGLGDDERPKLLIHVCCGPCFCYPLKLLNPVFDVTVYYSNSNIYPQDEYEHRLSELKRLLALHQLDPDSYSSDVKLVIPPYDHEQYMKDLHQFSSMKEGGYRCFLCYRKRMEEAYTYADEHGFDYFTTVMSVSPQKSSKILNSIGEELETHHKTKYLYSDFKKDDGVLKGIEIRKKYDLYYQDYCGCEYSIRESIPKKND